MQVIFVNIRKHFKLPENRFLYESPDKDDDYENREDILQIRLEDSRELYALSFVTLCEVLVKSPAPFTYAEEEIYKSTYGKKEV